jgi:ABC-2 type transport system permease protein
MYLIYAVARKEFISFFDSLIGYILLVLFLGFSGFFTWIYGTDVFLNGQASLRPFFSIAYWSLFFFIPAITMRLFAEENKVGTIEILLTKTLSDIQLIIGKFLAAWALIGVALIFTFPYCITIANLGNLDNAEVIFGYMGLMLLSGAYIAIGLFFSSTTNNQIVAFLSSLSVSLLFQIIFDVLSENNQGILGNLFYFMGFSAHFNSITRGVLDIGDVFFFFSIIIIFLLASQYKFIQRKKA